VYRETIEMKKSEARPAEYHLADARK
jgi:hypothetical protein